jgi:hypothetical protein
MSRKGFSLIESLLGLCFLFFIVISSLEIFGIARHLFFKIKGAEEESQAAFAALDKMRIDILHAGMGLLRPMRLGVLDGLSLDGGILSTVSLDKIFILAEDIIPGQTQVQLENTDGLSPGRELCLCDDDKGEARSIAQVHDRAISFSSPFAFAYSREQASLLLLERISFYYDENNKTIRRKVNLSPPQPLAEEIDRLDFQFEKATNLATLSFSFQAHKEKKYEISVFAKNTGLALPH